jgi:hypothetical protein
VRTLGGWHLPEGAGIRVRRESSLKNTSVVLCCAVQTLCASLSVLPVCPLRTPLAYCLCVVSMLLGASTRICEPQMVGKESILSSWDAPDASRSFAFQIALAYRDRKFCMQQQINNSTYLRPRCSRRSVWVINLVCQTLPGFGEDFVFP